MDKIIINDLEVFYRVGVPDDERAKPQRLLVCVAMTRDLSAAAASDDLNRTIAYYAVRRRLLGFGEGRSWKLLEILAADMPEMVLAEFRSSTATVEDNKSMLPE